MTPKKPKTLKDHILEETLEKPSESVAFLEKYHKSALKVKELKEGVSMWGQVLTVVAVFSVSLNAWNLMDNTPGNDVSESANPRLTSAATDELVEEIVMADGSLDLQAISSALSCVMWGLVAAKARYATSLVTSKDHIEVGKMVKSIGSLLLCTFLFCGTKLINDNKIIEQSSDFFQQKLDDFAEQIEETFDMETVSLDDFSFPIHLQDSNEEETQFPTPNELVDQWSDRFFDAFEEITDSVDEFFAKKEMQQYTPHFEIEVDEDNLEDLVEEVFGSDTQKYDFVPIEIAIQRLKNLIPVASCFILAIIYYVHTVAYQRVLTKHQNLTNLYYDPTVRVASGQSAKNIVARISGKAQVDSLKDKVDQVLNEYATV